MKTIREVFSKNLAAQRKIRALSQQAVADGAGIPLRTYQDIEAGKSWGRIETVTPICEFLGISDWELYQMPKIDKNEDLASIVGRIVIALGRLDETKLRGVLAAVELASRAVERIDLKKERG